MSRVPRTFALRDYGTARWEGGDEGCDHQSPNGQGKTGQRADRTFTANQPYRDLCGKCGARRVDRQIGLEPTPADFTAEMVRVFREVRRVLRPDGTCWLNMGDSMSAGKTGRTDNGRVIAGARTRLDQPGPSRQRSAPEGMRPKNLLGMPWRVAFALQADGWIIRQEIIWSKPNPMPESVTDRPTKSHEYLFLLSKNERYFYDADAVRRVGPGSHSRGGAAARPGVDVNGGNQANGRDFLSPEGGANLRSVWTIPTESFIGAHFATFPRRLVEPCIRAGTSARGCCPACGAPWVRVVESERTTYDGRKRTSPQYDTGAAHENYGAMERGIALKTTTTGWRPSCPCDAGEPVPATVLDIFAGSATTLVVAEALGRRGVGLDLSRDYLTMAARRLSRPHARIPRPGRDEAMPLFER